MDELNSRLERTEETISELEEQTTEIAQPEQHTQRKQTNRALETCGTLTKKIYIHVSADLEGKGKKGGGEKSPQRNIMAENLPNLATDINL